MGIDGIGKGGGPPKIPDAHGAGSIEKKGAVEKPFSVEPADRTTAAGAVDAPATSEALAKLRAGQIDVEGYVDLKVDEATRGLEGLSPTELVDLKQMLREQLATDPGLGDLVRTATGAMPKIPEE